MNGITTVTVLQFFYSTFSGFPVTRRILIERKLSILFVVERQPPEYRPESSWITGRWGLHGREKYSKTSKTRFDQNSCPCYNQKLKLNYKPQFSFPARTGNKGTLLFKRAESSALLRVSDWLEGGNIVARRRIFSSTRSEKGIPDPMGVCRGE